MMPFCYWKRCKRVAKYEVDLKVDDQTAWLCGKHFDKLWKILRLGCDDDE